MVTIEQKTHRASYQRLLTLILCLAAVMPLQQQAFADDAAAGTIDNGEAAPAWDFVWPSDDSLAVLFNRRVYWHGRELVVTPVPKAPHVKPSGVSLEQRAKGRSHLKVLLTSKDQKEAVTPGGGGLLAFLQKLFRAIWAKIFYWQGKKFSVSKILVDVKSVQAQLAGDKSASWVTVVDFGADGQVMDLAALQDGSYLTLTLAQMAPGSYQRVRFNLSSDNQIEVDEGKGFVMRPLSTPTRDGERIDLVKTFTISTTGMTSLKVEFDAQKSVLRQPNGSYLLRPVFTLFAVETNPGVSRTIPANRGGSLEIIGEVSLTIPANALTKDTVVSLVPTHTIGAHGGDDVLVFPYEYRIEPANLSFLKPATLSLHYPHVYGSALDLASDTIAVHSFDVGHAAWQPLRTSVDDDGDLVASVSRSGRFAVAGQPAVRSAYEQACRYQTDDVSLDQRQRGLDLRYFDAACGQLDLCYRFGRTTYGLGVEACHEAFQAQMLARCDDLCRSADLYGRACSALSEAEVAAHAEGADMRELMASCRDLVVKMQDDAVAHASERYPSVGEGCRDYNGAGVSCEEPLCALSVDHEEVPANIPQDLVFSLRAQGSVSRVLFDGTLAYQQTGLPLPIDETLTIRDNGRILSGDQTFTAAIYGPGTGDMPVTCEVTVRAKQLPPPCSLSVTPDVITAGSLTLVTLSAGPGSVSATLDLREPGLFGTVGLGTANADGVRQFKSNAKPLASRVFTARVVDSAGQTHVCTAGVVVN